MQLNYNYLWCLEDLLQSDDVRMVQSLEHLHLPRQHQDTPAARLCVCVCVCVCILVISIINAATCIYRNKLSQTFDLLLQGKS